MMKASEKKELLKGLNFDLTDEQTAYVQKEKMAERMLDKVRDSEF